MAQLRIGILVRLTDDHLHVRNVPAEFESTNPSASEARYLDLKPVLRTDLVSDILLYFLIERLT